MKNSTIKYSLWCALSLLCLRDVYAEVRYYDSGLFFSITQQQSTQNTTRAGRKAAVEAFIDKHFPNPAMSWEFDSAETDKTHWHGLYRLKAHGRIVLGQYLKVNYNHNGWVEHATSSWKTRFLLNSPLRNSTQAEKRWEKKLKNYMTPRGVVFDGGTRIDKVLWLDESTGRAIGALEIRMASNRPLFRRHFIVNESTDEILEEKEPLRSAARDIYKIHPDSGAAESVTFSDLTGSVLKDSYVDVQREQDVVTVERVAVDPDGDYTGNGNFDANDPYTAPTYSATCDTNGGDAACPNQSQEAVNVYYHMNLYRKNVNDYLSTLGASPNFSLDPMSVVVNTFLFGTSTVNNAFYASELETTGGSTIDGGVFFFRPASSECSGTGATVQWFHVAREALVVVHEYQHYVTDKIAKFVSGSGTKNVGDALHEGFSDYFAATQVSRNAGSDVTKIGAYAFKNCTAIQRDIGTLININDVPEIHGSQYRGGFSWASGLWQLRTELGREKTDLLALKSLFFITPAPGFLEAVESLVKADQALNGGANVSRIRDLFYNTLGFSGGLGGAFRDSSNYVVEVGFQSCSAVTRGARSHFSLLLFALWLLSTVVVGRRFRS